MYTSQFEIIAVEYQGVPYRVVSYGQGAAYAFHGGNRSVFFQGNDAERFGFEIEAIADYSTTDADFAMLAQLWSDVSTPDA